MSISQDESSKTDDFGETDTTQHQEHQPSAQGSSSIQHEDHPAIDSGDTTITSNESSSAGESEVPALEKHVVAQAGRPYLEPLTVRLIDTGGIGRNKFFNSCRNETEIQPDYDCAICLEAMDVTEEKILKNPMCSHVFHRACARRHVANTSPARCPLCRSQWTDSPEQKVWGNLWRSRIAIANGYIGRCTTAFATITRLRIAAMKMYVRISAYSLAMHDHTGNISVWARSNKGEAVVAGLIGALDIYAAGDQIVAITSADFVQEMTQDIMFDVMEANGDDPYNKTDRQDLDHTLFREEVLTRALAIHSRWAKMDVDDSLPGAYFGV